MRRAVSSARPLAAPFFSKAIMTATLPTPPTTTRPTRRPGWFGAFLVRLHFYAGILVGPFILVAALSGALYALSPTIEQAVYARQLHAPVTDMQLSLGQQVEIAEAHVGDAATLSAVRPAPEPGDTTRVMFAQDDLGESESRAVFVDPGTGEVRGDETVYGTSGSLPLRTAISNIHRSLGLGDPGRLYSELAASWLGIVVVAGVIMWAIRIRTARTKRDFVRPARAYTGYRRFFSWHTSVGIWIALGAVFLSATGITWSTYGGQNVTNLRAALDWTTPAVSTSLGGAAGGGDEHAGHGAASAALTVDPNTFDDVLAAARKVNIDTGMVQITPPAAADQAWKVQEIDRGFPGHLDAVAIDGTTLQTVDRVDFADFSLPAKLASWGVAIHMGVMFGLANQIVMFLLALSNAGMVGLGHVMWVKRRPTQTARVGMPPRRGVLDGAPWWGVTAVVAGGVLLGLALPLVGWTLAAFVVVDVIVDAVQRRRAAAG